MKRLTTLFLISALTSTIVFAQEEIISARSNAVAVSFNSQNLSEEVPSLVWQNPAKPNTTVQSKDFMLKIGVKSKSEVSDVIIFVDGTALDETRGLGVSKSSEETFDHMIERGIRLDNGTHEIKVLVENTAGEAVVEFRNVEVIAPVFGNQDRTDYALIFATNEYDEWDNLVNPVFDGTTIANELENGYGFNVELILNPTKTEILTKIREYANKNYLPTDQLFIFFAGHGQFDEVFTEGYVVARNSKKNDPAKETYISHSTLRTYVGNIPSNHIFLAMDVCFGGTFDQSIAQAGHRGAEMYGTIDTDDYIERKLRFKTRKYLTSGGKEYVPDGRPGQHSPFARQLVNAFRSEGGRDGILTLGEIINEVERLRPEPKFGDFPGDEPGSDFIFIKK